MPSIRLPQPLPPRPPDPAWTFGGVQRAALTEACPGGWTPTHLRLVESDAEETA